MKFLYSLGTQGAKEIVLEPSRSDSRLVPETSRTLSAVAVYVDDALSEEQRRHGMEGSECDGDSQDIQCNTNQKRKRVIYSESSTESTVKRPKHQSK